MIAILVVVLSHSCRALRAEMSVRAERERHHLCSARKSVAPALGECHTEAWRHPESLSGGGDATCA
jgi:hypothetical protein